jgi:putative PIN family toxin of toxin-antitoxin system
VLISAFIGPPGGASDRVIRAWRDGLIEIVISPTLVRELAEVLARPKFARSAGRGRADAYVTALAQGALRFQDPVDPPAVTSDPDDGYLIALALGSGASAIVSGDAHLTQLARAAPPVLTPREPLDRLE